MVIILNNGSLVNFSNVSMVSKDCIYKSFGKCSCYIHTLTLYSAGFPKTLVVEEADWNIANNVLIHITDAVASGKPIVDFREMGLTDGNRLTELKRELESAYEELEKSGSACNKQIDSFAQLIQEKKEAIIKAFRMPEDKAEKFLESDSQYMQCMVARKKHEWRQIQPLHAVKCEDDVLEKEMRGCGYKVRKGGK
ncbi:MAG: hypothetical protein HFH60_01515 [Lachnospiraceae bacterium]|nr:hypothetical protein [Lachnospiraceae bacterium]